MITRSSGVAVQRHIADVMASLDGLPHDELPVVLGQIDELRSRIWCKMLRPTPVVAPERSEPTLLTVPEVAKLLRFSRGHVYEMLRSGNLHGLKNGRAVRVTREALEDWQTRHGRRRLDDSYSVSPESRNERRPGEARSRSSGVDAAPVRRAPRRASGDRRQVGDGRPGHPGPGGTTDENARSKRHDGGQTEATRSAGETPQQYSAP
jgi:excisionase family DNA binding protein